MEIKTGQTWRHKARGTTYLILDDDSRIQISAVDSISMQRMLEAERWVSYRDVRGAPHPTCFRMYTEFGDGRFEQVWFDGGR